MKLSDKYLIYLLVFLAGVGLFRIWCITGVSNELSGDEACLKYIV